jgi:hypothetical protein
MGFVVDPQLLNEWELDVEFTPSGLKSEMDSLISDLEGWDLRKSTDLIKVWSNSNGTDVNDSIPAMRVEHYFPLIDDPDLILKALND